MVHLRMILIPISLNYIKAAEWQSGYAADCNSVNIGSIPFSASKKICPGGEIGRHKGLKIPRRKLRAGSSPALGTIKKS